MYNNRMIKILEKVKIPKPEYILLILVTVGIIYIFGQLVHAPELSWDDRINIFTNPIFLVHEYQDVWFKPFFGMFIPVSYSVWGWMDSFFF